MILKIKTINILKGENVKIPFLSLNSFCDVRLVQITSVNPEISSPLNSNAF